MLKHVSTNLNSPFSQYSSNGARSSRCEFSKYDLMMLRHHHHSRTTMDTISLDSSIGSNDSNNSLNDSTDSANTMNDMSICSNRSWSSSSQSLVCVGSPPPKVVIKIFTRVLCSDAEYKTLSITNRTTCREIVQIILKKFRLQNRDSNLFYLTLEAWIKRTGIPIRSVMTLDEDACPASLLQSCYPHKDLKFNLLMRRGETIKVYNLCLQGPSSSANVLISEKTNVEELLILLVNIFGLPEHHTKYELYQYSPSLKIERKLDLKELPVAIRMDWPNQDFNVFQIRPCSSGACKVKCSIMNSTVENFKKNLKSEYALNLLANSTPTTLPPIIQPTKAKVLYI